jgi:hypothetical protein
MNVDNTLPTTTVRRRALGRLIVSSLFDWRGIVLGLLLVIILRVILKNWTYALLGGVGLWLLAAIALLINAGRGAQAVAAMLRARFDPNAIRHSETRRLVRRALEYRAKIEDLVQRAQSGPLKDTMHQTANEIDDWLTNFYSMAQRLDRFQSDRTIRRDIQQVQLDLVTLKRRVENAEDERARMAQSELLEAKQKQWDALKALQDTMTRARQYIDNTLTALSTAYSQLLLIDVKDIDSGRAQRLRDDIKEDINRLQDLLNAIDEVYHQ